MEGLDPLSIPPRYATAVHVLIAYNTAYEQNFMQQKPVCAFNHSAPV